MWRLPVPPRRFWPIWKPLWATSPCSSNRSPANPIKNEEKPPMSRLPMICAPPLNIESDDNLNVNVPLLTDWLVAFLQDEIIRRRGFNTAVVGLSGGVDSSLVAFLLARALGPKNVYGIRMP